MSDFSTGELTVEGEYGECLVCGESFHWELLTLTREGPYCADHVNGDDQADMGHDTNLERDTFGDAL